MSKLCRIFVLVGVLAGFAQPAEADVGEHCAFRLVPLESDGGVKSASVDLVGCSGTYEAALEAGIGHTIDVGADVTPQTLTDEPLPSATITASVLIGTEYDGSGSRAARTVTSPRRRAHRAPPGRWPTSVPRGTTDSSRARGSAVVTPTGSSSTRTSADR